MGIAGTGPAAVTNQAGELKRVVDWVAKAYDNICARNPYWKFLHSRFSVNTVAGQEAYVPTACTDTEIGALIGSATVGAFAQWMPYTFRIYLQSAGSGTRQHFWQLDYAYFRDRYQLQPPANAQPAEWSIRPRDNALLLGPKPNAVYVVEGDYYRVAPPLAADGDAPLFPERFHMAIVWLAKRYYAGHEEDGGIHADSQDNFDEIYGGLLIDQLPTVIPGAPLA